MIASLLQFALMPRPDEKDGKSRTFIEKMSRRTTAACAPGIICMLILTLIMAMGSIRATVSASGLENYQFAFGFTHLLALVAGLYVLEWFDGATQSENKSLAEQGAMTYFLMATLVVIVPVVLAAAFSQALIRLPYLKIFDVVQTLGIVCATLYVALAWTHIRRFPKWYFEEERKKGA